MKFIFVGHKVKRFLFKPCRRWSILVSLILYIVSFTLVIYLEIPLKSDDRFKTKNHVKARGDNNIIEYLHRLHNLKSSQEILDNYDKIKIRPLYTLEETFHKADDNQDNYLSIEELSKWISTKTQEHIHEAIVENYKMFVAIDVKPKNDLISWKEYHSYFLEKNGLNKSYIISHSEKHSEISRSMKEAIMRDKAAWSECAKLDPDHLTLDEFLSFRHPESSYSTIISLVDEIYRKFDRDGDDVLTEDEFSTFQSEDDFEKSELIHQEENERRKEFQEIVDLNKDGRATRREMTTVYRMSLIKARLKNEPQLPWCTALEWLYYINDSEEPGLTEQQNLFPTKLMGTYIDPRNPRHAKEEAETLFDLADVDKDGRLSLTEIFNKMDLFLGSKMVDTARNFHDEF